MTNCSETTHILLINENWLIRSRFILLFCSNFATQFTGLQFIWLLFLICYRQIFIRSSYFCINPQYDERLFIEIRVQYMKIASSEHEENMGRTCCVHRLFFCFCFDIQNNLCTQHVLLMFSPCSELAIFMYLLSL